MEMIMTYVLLAVGVWAAWKGNIGAALIAVLFFVAQGSYSAIEAHKHTHEIIEILAAMNGGQSVFDEDGRRL